jgi:dTDP-4-dehydrorhamnose 3,5-epimerase
MQSSIEGLHIIQRNPLIDSRGFFERLYCTNELESIINNRKIVQINHSFTKKSGSVRGLHYQIPPYSEMKIITCLRGKVFDVAVDLRKNSPTFLKWHSEILSEDNFKTIIIPEGFAHGFQTLTDDSELLYFHTTKYTPKSGAGINALDSKIQVKWPLQISNRSLRDENLPFITSEYTGIQL